MSERPASSTAPILAGVDDDDLLRAYVDSMPRSYRQLFNDDAIAAHAAIAHRRGASATRVEAWRELPGHVVALAIVADDCAGLLARITAAFVAHDFDVVAAQAYCRRRDGLPAEAVDLFWVRRLAPVTGSVLPIRPFDVAVFGETLDALVRGRASFDRAVPFARAARPSDEPTRVRFATDERDGSMVLTVQGADRPGLLFLITEALFREDVRIARSDVTTHEGKVLDRFHLTELDGGALRRARLLGIQTAVFAAIEAAHRLDAR